MATRIGFASGQGIENGCPAALRQPRDTNVNTHFRPSLFILLFVTAFLNGNYR
jgi:hypothetical protein